MTEKIGDYAFLDNKRIKKIEDAIQHQVNDIKRYLEESFEKEYITIGDHWNYNRLSTSWWPIEFYQIASDKEIYISSIIAKSLDLKKEDIEKANQKLNTEIIKINKQLS